MNLEKTIEYEFMADLVQNLNQICWQIEYQLENRQEYLKAKERKELKVCKDIIDGIYKRVKGEL